MLRKWLGVLVSLLVLAGLGFFWSSLIVRAATEPQTSPAPTPTPVATVLPRHGDAESPAISSIDNPSPTCYRATAKAGVCYIQWSYLQVIAAPSSYIISMTVTIDERMRAYQSGFFQTSMFVPGEMYGPGFKVTCGFPESGGVIGLGKTYNFAIRARETSGNITENYGSVTCPADEANVFMPIILKH